MRRESSEHSPRLRTIAEDVPVLAAQTQLIARGGTNAGPRPCRADEPDGRIVERGAQEGEPTVDEDRAERVEKAVTRSPEARAAVK